MAAENEGMEEEIKSLKDEITTCVQLAEKYSAAGLDDVAPAENETKEPVPELANRISQLEVEIAVLNDSLESGQTGIPLELAKEHEDLKKVISRLLKWKKSTRGRECEKEEAAGGDEVRPKTHDRPTRGSRD
jgi:hypothetical protein